MTTDRAAFQEHFLLAWCNLALFDYRRQLLTGKKKLTLWPVPKGQFPNENLFPLEPVGRWRQSGTEQCGHKTRDFG